MAANVKTISIQDLSERINVPAKTIRKVLRANSDKDTQPGRGARWIIRESDVNAIQAMIESHSAKSGAVFVPPTTD